MARTINIAKFRAKKVGVMLVTDIAARGIDIPLLDNVINVNFPAKPKLYVHRVGKNKPMFISFNKVFLFFKYFSWFSTFF